MISRLVMYLFLFPGPIFQNRLVLIQVLLLLLLIWVKNCRSPLKLTFSQLSSEKNMTLCIPHLLLCASEFGKWACVVTVPWGILPLGIALWATRKALCEWLRLEMLSGENLVLPFSLLSPGLNVRTVVVFTHLNNMYLLLWDRPGLTSLGNTVTAQDNCPHMPCNQVCARSFPPNLLLSHLLLQKVLMSLLYQSEPWLPPWLSLWLNIMSKACHFFCCMFSFSLSSIPTLRKLTQTRIALWLACGKLLSATTSPVLPVQSHSDYSSCCSTASHRLRPHIHALHMQCLWKRRWKMWG